MTTPNERMTTEALDGSAPERPVAEWPHDTLASLLYVFADEHPYPRVREAMLEAVTRIRTLDAVTRERDQYRRTLSETQGSLHVINSYAHQIARFHADPNLDVVDHSKRIQTERLKAHQRISDVLFPESSASAPPNASEKPEGECRCGHHHSRHGADYEGSLETGCREGDCGCNIFEARDA